MKKWALILNGQVTNIIDSEEKPNWGEFYTGTDIPIFFYEANDEVQPGWRFDGEKFSQDQNAPEAVIEPRNCMTLLTVYAINDCSRRCSYCPCGEWNYTDPNADLEEQKRFGYPNPGAPNMLTEEALFNYITKWFGQATTRIEFTGGEPSMLPWMGSLLERLSEKNYHGIIRHNGDFPLPKTNFTRVTAWHDPYPTLVKYPGDIFLIFEDDKDKQKWCEDNGYPFKLIFKDTQPKKEDLEKMRGFGRSAYIYSCGQLAKCSNGSCALTEQNIWNDSPPVFFINPCFDCQAIMGYEYVKEIS